MYRTIIFDIDGTLINTEQAVLNSLQKLLKMNYNREVDISELAFVLGIPGAVSLKQLGIKDDEIDFANDSWNAFMRDYQHTIHVYEGIQQLITTLSEHSVTMGVVTSKTKKEYGDDFSPFGLHMNIHYAVCADDTDLHKPNPEPLLKFLEISGARAEESIYIGDTIYDSQCALDAGVDFGLALWGCKQGDTIPATYKFKHPLDILTHINLK